MNVCVFRDFEWQTVQDIFNWIVRIVKQNVLTAKAPLLREVGEKHYQHMKHALKFSTINDSEGMGSDTLIMENGPQHEFLHRLNRPSTRLLYRYIKKGCPRALTSHGIWSFAHRLRVYHLRRGFLLLLGEIAPQI